MNKQQENHLAKIQEQFIKLSDTKYAKGAKQHGGYLWKKPNLIGLAIDEAIDQVIYLLSLKQQLKNIKLGDKKHIDKDL